jgi:Flp pilus assembly protein TadB
VFRPIIDSIARGLDRLIDREGDLRLASMIRQAGLFPDLPEAERIGAYRIRQLGSVAAWGGAALALVPLLGLSVGQFFGMEVLMLIVGGTRQRGQLERAIEGRRSRMTIEIYTVNQLLAMRVRAGGGVVSAVSAICERGTGDVVSELREALRMHRAGAGISAAFDRIARTTPEPYCARTYALLAIAEERGVDLAKTLLALSEDVREARRESIKRSATKRRAAMLIPTIAILAPVMLLFVGAPLPRLLLGT